MNTLTEYVSLDKVLNALKAVKIIETNLRKGEILDNVRQRVLELEREVDRAAIAELVETELPAIPYSVISRPAWLCGHCSGEVWYRDHFCRHCGAKLERTKPSGILKSAQEMEGER
jgi:hypothetical protein